MTTGKIIFLNGTSSSGKATIALALQDNLPEPFLRFSVDDFLHLLPARFFQDPDENLTDDLETALIELYPRLISGLHHSVAALASHGVNIIVDHILQVQEWLEECVDLLSSYPVLFVGVRCDLTEVSRREQDDNRVEGLARMQSEVVHAHKIYDLEVDTCEHSPEDCALAIQNVLEHGWAPTAFQIIREKNAAGTLWP